jgi:hypothetical protein
VSWAPAALASATGAIARVVIRPLTTEAHLADHVILIAHLKADAGHAKPSH